MSEWQPIAMAPKDRPIILAYTHYGKRCVGEGEWGLGRYDRSKREYEHAWCIGTQITVTPYAWQPMPKAPPKAGFQKERAGE